MVNLNHTHCVCKKGLYLSIISTVVETDNPKEEIQPALSLLGDILETFITISDFYEPIDTEFKDNVFIPTNHDSLSHFEHDVDNVLSIYNKITGKPYDLNFE